MNIVGGAIDWLTLLVQNEAGWDNLCRLVSRAHLGRPIELDPHVTLSDMAGQTDGLLCLTGAGEGALVKLLAEGRVESAAAYAERLEALFPGRLYVEIARRNDAIEEAAEAALIDLAYARDLPLLATNPAKFGEPVPMKRPLLKFQTRSKLTVKLCRKANIVCTRFQIKMNG